MKNLFLVFIAGSFLTNCQSETSAQENTQIALETNSMVELEKPELTLVWSDEFDATTLNLDNWTYELGDGCPNLCGWGNNELQYYTNRPENVTVQNGLLVISAIEEDYNGASFTSAELLTKGEAKLDVSKIKTSQIMRI